MECKKMWRSGCEVGMENEIESPFTWSMMRKNKKFCLDFFFDFNDVVIEIGKEFWMKNSTQSEKSCWLWFMM